MSEVVPHEPEALVEHFFRHESAKLVAVLTRAFGWSRIDLVEDQVQEAMVVAMTAFRRRGVPDNPSGWIHRVARNRILDVLRREKVHQQAVSHTRLPEATTEDLLDEWLSDSRLPDSLLRMMFVCCHPSLDRISQIAMTLKILCGFSVAEIARGLLMSEAATKKRIQRAKKSLAEREVQLDLPPANELAERLDAVHDVLYVMFNEGYSTSRGHQPLRDDICEEAARLCHLLCEHDELRTGPSCALLALMLFHGARMDSRVDSEGVVVLLEDQDRRRWDQGLIVFGQRWLTRSARGPRSRFHLEAAISLRHCQAQRFDDTDWAAIVRLYGALLELRDSPIYVLNRAIARGELGETERALAELEQIRNDPRLRDYFLLDCAVGRVQERAGRTGKAVDAYSAAREHVTAEHERALLDKKLAALT